MGLLVESAGPAHIGVSLVTIVKDPAERERELGGAGYTRTTSEFTWTGSRSDRGLYKELGSPELPPRLRERGTGFR